MLAAVKLVPLGQSAGQRMLRGLGNVIPTLVEDALRVEDAAIAQYTIAGAHASALHEAQYTRLFRLVSPRHMVSSSLFDHRLGSIVPICDVVEFESDLARGLPGAIRSDPYAAHSVATRPFQPIPSMTFLFPLLFERCDL